MACFFFAAAAATKGGGEPPPARLRERWIDDFGRQEVTIRTDGEPSICDLVRRTRELRAGGATTVDEVSPPGGSAANGMAGQPDNWPREDDNGHCGGTCTCWSYRWPASDGADGAPCRAGTQRSVGADGLTPIRRLKGRKFGTELAGVGERVWLSEPALGKVNKFNPRCGGARLLGFVISLHRDGP